MSAAPSPPRPLSSRADCLLRGSGPAVASRGRPRPHNPSIPDRLRALTRWNPWTEQILRRICRNPERYADRVEFAYVDDAAHFITDDAPGAVADLALDWFERAA